MNQKRKKKEEKYCALMANGAGEANGLNGSYYKIQIDVKSHKTRATGNGQP